MISNLSMRLILRISQNETVKLQLSKVVVLLCNLFINFNFVFLLHRSCLLKFCSQVLFLNVEIIHCFFWKIPSFIFSLLLLNFFLDWVLVALWIIFFLIYKIYFVILDFQILVWLLINKIKITVFIFLIFILIIFDLFL